MATVGKPPKYRSAAQMEEAMERYFASIGDAPPTVAGMTYFLGFADRSSLEYYKREKPAFRQVIRRARLRIEASLEQQLMRGSSVTGIIFNLKNNFGWKDAQEFTHTGPGGSPLSIEVQFVDGSSTDT